MPRIYVSSRIRMSAMLALTCAMSVIAPSAHAGRRIDALQRKMAKNPTLSRLLKLQRSGPAVLAVAPHEMVLELPNQPVWAAFGKNDAKGAAKVLSTELGRQLARRGFALATGGGSGLPKDTEDGAYEAGGQTIAFSPKADLASHSASHDGNILQTTHLVATGTGGGPGTISREGPMAQAANHGVASFANGGPGTFGEWSATLHNQDGVMVFLKGTGGVADAAPGWMKWADAKPGFKTIVDSDPRRLATEAARAVAALGASRAGGKTQQVRLVSPGPSQKVLKAEETEGRIVSAFMTEDPRASAADQARTQELVDRWVAASTDVSHKGATVVLPSGEKHDGGGLAQVAAKNGTPTILISPEHAGATPAVAGARTVHLGFGSAEMGNFAAAREVTQGAKVVFFSSARYRNLPALAYVLRDPDAPLIGVLANESTFGDKLPEMIDVIEPGARGRVVVGKTPAELVEKVKARLASQPRAGHFDDKGGLD